MGKVKLIGRYSGWDEEGVAWSKKFCQEANSEIAKDKEFKKYVRRLMRDDPRAAQELAIDWVETSSPDNQVPPPYLFPSPTYKYGENGTLAMCLARNFVDIPPGVAHNRTVVDGCGRTVAGSWCRSAGALGLARDLVRKR